jgi:hypothetical protein
MKNKIEPEQVQKLAIKALFFDDYLLSKIVLKGGNALVHVHRLIDRTSLDIDVSIRGDLDKTLEELESTLVSSFQKVFDSEDLVIFDTRFFKKPGRSSSKDLDTFWGGYAFEFKVISKEDHQRIGKNVEKLRRESLIIDALSRKSFCIDFSKQEHCDPSVEVEFESRKIVVYTPLLIAIEKLRAICQQQTDYQTIVPTMKRAPRPRDFFDIHMILESQNLGNEILTKRAYQILKEVFNAKRVPLSYLHVLEDSRDFHEAGFAQLLASIPRGVDILPFGFYFDYTLKIVRALNEHFLEVDL